MGDCLDEETVALLVEGRLGEEGVRAVTAHIDVCDDCRELVAEAARDPEATQDASGMDDVVGGGPLPRGATIGRYVVGESIGAGAMGIVYTARDPDLGRQVALKLLRNDPSTPAADGGRARLLREAQAIAKLSHPSVITIHDVGTVGDEVFLAMELVDGGTLGRWVRERRPWREVLAVMHRAGEGLEAAHAAGLVHRDFKPDNVLVGRDGRVRVTDFGLARVVSASAETSEESAAAGDALHVTRTGTIAGTPAYMPPEVLAGQPADVRADVFSYCASFYEVLYGERPFEGTTILQLTESVRAGRLQPPPPGSRVPAWLRRVLIRGLDARPEKRPPSVRAVLDELDAASSAARGRLVGMVAAAALVVAGGLGAIPVARGRSSRSAAAASASPTEPPVALTDQPLPSSSSPEALRFYARGLQGMRDGTWGASDFERATQLDPALAAAHLRYAMLQFWQLPTEGRAHLAKAVEERAALTPRDLGVLRAAQAWMQSDPTDDAAFARLMDEAESQYPGDAEIAYYAGFARTMSADHPAAIARLDRAVTLDPGFAAAYQLEADEKAYAGDLAGALTTLEACVARAPEATRCLMERVFIEEAGGDCASVEADGRRMRAHDPESSMSYEMLATAAYAQGKPIDVVRELLHESEEHTQAAWRPRAQAKDAYELAALAGDFDEARRHASELGALAGSSPDRRTHVSAAILEAAASLEAGQPQQAARVADEYFRLEEAWAPEPRSDDFAVLRDSSPFLWAADRAAGALSPSDFDAKRDGWARSWLARLPEGYRPYVWLHGYARVAASPDEAARALAEQPRFGPIPRFTPLTFGDAFVGQAYLLAGRVAEAIPVLRRATHACVALGQPIDHTRAALMLGQALAQSGDPSAHDEACGALGVVLARWGHARPRSVSAEKARALSAELGCR